jgi:bromodomain-containing factor 1
MITTQDVHDDELELDVEEIPDDVLRELYNFVKAFKRQIGVESASDEEYEEFSRRASVAAASKPSGSRKKNKPMSAKEQESKIAQVKEQLQRFEAGTHGGHDGECGSSLNAELNEQCANTYTTGGMDSSDDESSSSSEEE